VLRDKCTFKALKNYVKIQNVKSIGGQIHVVYGKGKMKLSCTLPIKYNTFLMFFYVLTLMKKLLLIGQMIVDKGSTMVFDINKCLVVQNQNTKFIVLKGVKDCNNELYKLRIHSFETI
jgi:hypothetical protein